ncbi:MAG: hypothetical protein LBD48_00190 [Treponema sp.]|jgi:hypothetical protein|nr:hypothetical protein [Treponema sp.]
MLRDQYTISSQSGTALFYGVHQALANLKANETRYPANLQSVNVITFTDGLDNGSTGQAALRPIESQSPEMTAAYAAYVQQQIANRTIAGKSITAYSVGVMGSDVTDTAGFQTALTQIASRTQNANQLDDFSEVEETFETIAGGLNIVTTSAVFNMTTPTGDSGTKVRITFDNVQPANPADIQADTAAVNASTKWIQGTRIRTGTGASTTYTLTDITYSAGITSGAGSGPITGFLDEQGVEVAFTFRNVVGLPEDLQASQVKQWFQPSGVTTWQINSEYFMGNAVTSTVEKKSSIIYLVLDSSRSLSTEQIAAIRAAAGSFIGSLYEQLNPED